MPRRRCVKPKFSDVGVIHEDDRLATELGEVSIREEEQEGTGGTQSLQLALCAECAEELRVRKARALLAQAPPRKKTWTD